MNHGHTGIAAAILAVTAALPASAGDRLSSLAWKARPVVVLGDGAGDPRFKEQIARLDKAHGVLKGYDIKVLPVTDRDPGLRQKLGVPDHGFAVALVGKDGGVKATWTEPVQPKTIFALIDTMPMRQDEVRGRR